MGESALFEERQVGSERFNLFTGCPHAKTATIVLRGGADQVRVCPPYQPLGFTLEFRV